MSIGSFFFFFHIKWKIFKGELKVVFRYYKSIKFALFDLCFHLIYLFENPYRTSRKFSKNNQEEEVYTYGETPLTQMEKMAQAFFFKKEDIFLDLGSGRSRHCFWLNHFIGCKTLAFEQIPSFILKAKILNSLFFKNELKFIPSNFLKENLPEATLIYFYQYFLKEKELSSLLEKISKNKKAKVISIGFPLCNYSSSYQTEKSIPVTFVWGKTRAFLNVIKN